MSGSVRERQKTLLKFFGPATEAAGPAVLTERHGKNIQDLVNSAYQADPIYRDGFQRIPDEQYDQFVKDIFSNKQNKIVYGYFDKGALVACACLDIHEEEFGLFAVHPNYQGKALGDKLLKFVETSAKENYGISFLKLYVINLPPHAKLMKYYLRAGYAPNGNKRKSRAIQDIHEKFRHDNIQALEMHKNLTLTSGL